MLFGQEFPETAAAHMALVPARAEESALDPKTTHLAYLAVRSAAGTTSGIDFHVGPATQSGAADDEIRSAALVAMQAVGLRTLDGLAAVCAALDPGTE